MSAIDEQLVLYDKYFQEQIDILAGKGNTSFSTESIADIENLDVSELVDLYKNAQICYYGGMTKEVLDELYTWKRALYSRNKSRYIYYIYGSSLSNEVNKYKINKKITDMGNKIEGK